MRLRKLENIGKDKTWRSQEKTIYFIGTRREKIEMLILEQFAEITMYILLTIYKIDSSLSLYSGACFVSIHKLWRYGPSWPRPTARPVP